MSFFKRNAKAKGSNAKQQKELEEITRLAELGDAIEQYNLGMMYLKGNGVQPDSEKAPNGFRRPLSRGMKTRSVTCKNYALCWMTWRIEVGKVCRRCAVFLQKAAQVVHLQQCRQRENCNFFRKRYGKVQYNKDRIADAFSDAGWKREVAKRW